ncbi:MAG: 3-oxo-tetronate 4-phosphate decarboxylase [Chloroflexi bacterium]|nr:3-oxo-tetronate 4-phosphate decarboxylase [Chloroflexota bacterium]
MTPYEEQLRQEIIRVTCLEAEQGLIRSSDGNTSARLDEDRLLVTPSGVHKMTMKADNLILVNREGEVLRAKPGLKPTSELRMHLEVYRQRPDVQAVLHAHPPYTTALTLVESPFPTEYLPEVLVALGEVPTAPYATPGTAALANSIRDLIQGHDTVILSHHGSLHVGQSLEEALIALERLEHAAYTYCLAHNLGNPVPLPEAELHQLKEIGQQLRG